MQAYVRVIRSISQLCGFVAAGLIAAGVLVVCHMVFVRYVLNQNTIWQTDFTTYCLIGATFIGSPYVLLTRGTSTSTCCRITWGGAGAGGSPSSRASLRSRSPSCSPR